MIKRLNIQRFKCHKSAQFDLRRMTVLTGTNASGKSTVLQALLLLRIVAESKGIDVPLNGPFGLHLGEVLDVLNRSSEMEEGIFLSAIGIGGEIASAEFKIARERSRVLALASYSVSDFSLTAPNANTFTFISADRLGPQDAYEVKDMSPSALNVGFHGEAVAQVLECSEKREVQALFREPFGDRVPHTSKVPVMTELWLEKVIKAVQIQTHWVLNTSIVTLRFRDIGFNSEWVRPSNTGFGLTSVLPVIVAGLVMQKHGILLVENPELHLHPRAQSALGSFLGRVAAAGVQVILETHSDHILNGIRRAIAVERTLAPEDTIFHFFDERDGAIHTSAIDIHANGNLSSWPTGFFDQIEEDLGTLARNKRR